MSNYRLSRRAAGLMLGAAAVSPAIGLRPARAQTLDKFSYQTNWRAQAEHGGFYQALATGLYKEAGLDVEVRQGGPQLDVNAMLLAGRADLVETDAFRVFNFARDNVPGLAIAAMFQKDLRAILSHPGVGNDSLAALKGKPILIGAAGRTSFWQWLKARYGYTDEQVRPYTFNLAPFLADKQISQQGFVTSEPFAIRQAGVDPVIHLLADNGFVNYPSISICLPKTATERKDVVQRFVDASVKGWKSYLTGDPAPANALIKRDNPDMTDDKIAYAIKVMRDAGVVGGGDAASLGIGALNAQRWNDFYKDMVDCGALPGGWDVAKLMTPEFVNKKVAMI
ncbi:MAG: ABC transporter substrate-binding protein [Reyranella sp.]|uniref:ABC transporter substrate-binding protein n=1 Tax=Reyranella sp. TaxID=1929291 RepID=UPI001AD0069B|nr:ABC transporter substrate-binding protein [Reyranella sp.]MBN9090934.1 ABC transporter substrate-binding protein [Reyranella sp.]